MDGTLIASTRADFVAWQKLFADYGIELTYDNYYFMLGKRSVDIVNNSLGLTGTDAELALQKKMLYFEEVMASEGIEKIPHAEELLKQVRTLPLKIALATSSRRPKTELVMRATGLIDYFDVIVTGDEITNGKPAPDIFIAAANQMQIPQTECLVFEDSISGIMAAHAASMKCIAICTTHRAEQLKAADLIIESFEGNYENLCAAVLRS
jgi:beta-phosphoglucomutase